MSHTKNATSRKRKLADLDQAEPILALRKPETLSLDSSESTPAGVHALGVSPKEIVASDMRTASVKLTELEVNHEQRTGALNYREDHSGESGVVVEAHEAENEQTKENILHSEPKEKGSLRQAKSERRSKKKRKPDLADIGPALQSSPSADLAAPPTDGQGQRGNEIKVAQQNISSNPSKSESKQRFIVFIGNLPFTATESTIKAHFSKLQPFTLRHSTSKDTGRSRGFAFLEFEGYDKMKTCLKLFHHSLFDASGDQTFSGAGKERKSQARKINVELTAGGGGGKSATRKERIKGRNEKLEVERERARAHREKEEVAANRKKRKVGEKTGANAVEMNHKGNKDENMHPSRQKRMES